METSDSDTDSSRADSSSDQVLPKSLRLMPIVVSVPFNVTCRAWREEGSTPESLRGKVQFQFELSVSAVPGAPPLNQSVAAVKFKLHSSFGKDSQASLTREPFSIRRRCWAENLVIVKVFFRGLRAPMEFSHMVRLKKHSTLPPPPSGKSLESAQPLPSVGDVALGDHEMLETTVMNAAVVMQAPDDSLAQYSALAWTAVAGLRAAPPPATKRVVAVSKLSLRGLEGVAESAAALDSQISHLLKEHSELAAALARDHESLAKEESSLQARLDACLLRVSAFRTEV